ncbi:hypothetical protein [Chondromyces apiculatus]|uniref:hypothetical protein n=1 Tax=Chondromyces apiculatus TaxID=51 RepID=UPI0012DC6BD9|nr:hypothetical protein [Chondromyces apiculatus]
MEDFCEPLHRSLAAALVAGRVSEELGYPEVAGYLRGLLRSHAPDADPLPATLRVATLGRQRRALRIVERVASDLRQVTCDQAQVIGQLRQVIERLEGGEVV